MFLYKIIFNNTKMMELVDMLGLGSSSFNRVWVQVPFLVKDYTFFKDLSINLH